MRNVPCAKAGAHNAAPIAKDKASEVVFMERLFLCEGRILVDENGAQWVRAPSMFQV
jgi:hypothetical protein